MGQCESCGMPLDEKTTSKIDGRYCIYCQNQESGELASKEQVREGSIQALMRLQGKSREEAEEIADEMMPKLPRWQK
ncbi:MAG: zinc ribbon domain-containing protein [bacterium]